MAKKITTDEIREKLDDEGVFYKLIDLSRPEEFSRYHLPNAINVPLGPNALAGIQRVADDREETVILYSPMRDTGEVAKLADQLEALGYKEVFDYKAGEQAWRSEKLPSDPPRP